MVYAHTDSEPAPVGGSLFGPVNVKSPRGDSPPKLLRRILEYTLGLPCQLHLLRDWRYIKLMVEIDESNRKTKA